jgi:ABC-type multidrug transport system ATPase subunit
VNRGKLIANGTIEELRKLSGDSNDLVYITVFNSQNTIYALSKLSADIVIRYKVNDTDRKFKIVVVDPKHGDISLNEIMKSFDKVGLQIYEIRRVNVGLEEIFFKLTEKSRSKANYNIDQQDNLHGQQKLSSLSDLYDETKDYSSTSSFGMEKR